MNSIIFFSSILIAALAIQTSKCSVQVVDSFFPLSSQSSYRATSQRSHSSRSNSNSKNNDKKIEKFGVVERANPMDPTTYMNVGGVQQPTTMQDGSIKPGNDVAYYYTNNRNQRQRYPSQSNTYRSSQLPRSNSLNFPKTAKLKFTFILNYRTNKKCYLKV